MKHARCVAALLCACCGSARLAGGSQVAPGSEPPGDAVGTFRFGRCEDARGVRIAEPEARITVVKLKDGKLVLVERRPGYDSWIVSNGFREGNERVFQLALKRASSAPYLREYRTPLDDAGLGKLSVVKDVRAWGDSASGFHARFAKAALVCTLTPL